MNKRLKKLKFAFIGCGRVAPFHADVVRHLGHRISVVVSRENSVNIQGFAERYEIEQKIYGIERFIEYYREHNNMVDCILVCTPWKVTEDVLRRLLPLGVPVMAEKPAVLSVDKLNHLKEKCDMQNLFVAYNRRFYDFVPFLKELIKQETLICVDILSAEPFEMIMATNEYGREACEYMLYIVTSHTIDLMFYMLGDIEFKDIVNITRNGRKSWVCELYANEYKFPIQMKILMDCPQNSYLKVFFEKKVALVCPFEKMMLYDRLERRENGVIATYEPGIQREFAADDTFKPGFLNQMNYFIKNFVCEKNSSLEHIEQLEKVTYFCDTLRNLRRCHG